MADGGLRRAIVTLTVLPVGPLLTAVATAEPAAAHAVGGGDLPAPPWLVGYLGLVGVGATVVILRATWSAPRRTYAPPISDTAHPAVEPRVHGGHLVGLALLLLVLVAAIVGPDSSASNIAPVAVLVIWWVGLPLVAFVAGDVMRHINPFLPLVALLDRGRPLRAGREAPVWTAAAFLAGFSWFFVSYHRPGSARALAVGLLVYTIAAVAGGLLWGRSWVMTGEAFGGLSAAVAGISPSSGRRVRRTVRGLAPLMVVWIGGTAFDGFANTPFWQDVVGTSTGWTRTAWQTVGLVWITAIAAGIYLSALRLADRAPGEGARSLPLLLSPALVPMGLAWFVAHDLTLLLFEGQGFIVLLSDPIGRGWDLLDTVSHSTDPGVVEAAWVGWVQLLALMAGHLGAVVVGHDLALRARPHRAALTLTWALAAVSGVSVVAAALLVLG